MAKSTPKTLNATMVAGRLVAVKKYFEANRIVKGIPYISTNRETKNAVTNPYSAQFAFLWYDKGIKNKRNIAILINTICHCCVITSVIIFPVR